MEKSVGIDLGTTYSVVAVTNELGRAEVLPNREGDLTTPSVVLFDPDEPQPLVGVEAQQLAQAMPDRVVEAVKREMGRPTEWEFDGQIYTPDGISALILGKLKQDAEYRLGEPVRQAVITVPAYFANQEREATRQAGLQAGLKVLQIINEPTAAAIACRLGESAERETVLVYDLGGGTFDITLLEAAAGDIRVLTTQGDVKLGGKDWDQTIVDLVAGRFAAEHGFDPRSDTYAYQDLAADAERAKRSLTERQKVSLTCRAGGKSLSVTVTRDEFEELSSALVERTRSTVDLVLNRTNLTACREPARREPADRVHRVLLVGGSTRMPAVRRMLDGVFPGRVDATVRADECVAIGAAIQAARLMIGRLPSGSRARLPAAVGKLADLKIQDITAHSLGTVALKEDEPVTSFIIPKDTPIPAKRTREDYTTTRDDQDSLIVPVLQGESADPHLNQLLACYEFQGIPPRRGGESRLRVAFGYDSSGLVEVEAWDIETGRQLERAQLPLENLDDLRPQRAEPLRVVLLVDVSGSMSGEPLEHAKQGAVTFVDDLLGAAPRHAGGAGCGGRHLRRQSGAGRSAPSGDVQVAVVEFGSKARMVAELGSDADAARSAIAGLEIYGSTAMSDAIIVAHRTLVEQIGRKVIVLLTDGAPDRRDHTRRAAAEARNEGIALMAIGCPGADTEFLDEICTPGLDPRSVTDTSQLSREFANLAAELTSGTGLKTL